MDQIHSDKGLIKMVKITQNTLFLVWFGAIIVLDKIGTIFNISSDIVTLLLLIISGIIVYAIYRINKNEKRNKQNYVVEYTVKRTKKILAKDEEDAKVRIMESYENNPEINFMSIKKIDEMVAK